jgi:hypothetical protein
LPEEERIFYEIIPGNVQQKMRYDLDLKREKYPDLFNMDYFNDLISRLIKATVEIGQLNKFDPSKDVMICTSHSDTKLSAHIIFQYLCVDNNHAKQIYDYTIKSFSNDEKEIIDHSVYSKKQNFRFMMCHKLGSDRIKMIEYIWRYGDKEVTNHFFNMIDNIQKENWFVQLMSESMITKSSRRLEFFPLFTYEEEKYKIGDIPPLNEKMEKYVNLLMDNQFFTCFSPIVKGNLIILIRKKTSECPICQRDHENENSYAYVTNKGIFYTCRRDPTKTKYFLGKL